jgi:hypothetical protein
MARLRRVAFLAWIAAGVVSLAACHGAPRPDPTPPPGAVTDTAPYWCQLVPRTALWQVTGVAPSQVVENLRSKDAAPDNDLECTAQLAGDFGLLVEIDSGRFATQVAFQQLRPGRLALSTLPADLGLARARHNGPQWFGFALYYCGRSPHLALISLQQVVADRDPLTELAALLTIAERRWAAMAKCTLNTSAPPPVPAP